ncbi:sulfonate transport system permease protein [Pseudarthrobacter defluvii]|uniref:ABC transporter permease n=1 Tax=Pseudarthrobacter defluvii TaxID=410837 RepID=UPI002785D756|nr:ABC transporter permease [Pseudarthrobacter defluvii]MDQ0770745.1 sulfonate transport system permease protein [Pseudarthrobacter defluvii]
MNRSGEPTITGTNVADGRAAAATATAAHAAQTGAGTAPAPAPGWSPAGVRSRNWARLPLGLIIPAALLAAWQVASTNGMFTVVQLPPPAMVLAAADELVERGELGTHIAISTQRVLIGFLVGAALGLVLGATVGLSKLADALLAPTIGALRAVPSLAWVPLLILWMKIGEDSKVTLIIIGAFFPVFTTVSLALRHVDRNLVEAARAFGLKGVRLLTTVQLPAVVPAVFSGLRLALAQAWLFLVAAELIASSMGLGFLLIDSQNNGRTDRLLLAIVMLAVIGKITDALLGLAEKWAVKRWA